MAPALALLLRGGEPQTAATAVAATNSTSDVITIASHGGHRHTGAHVVIAVRVVVSFLAFLVLLVCGIRLYLRKFVLRKFDLNDVLVIISLILALGFNALSLVWTAFGGGSHVYEVSPETVAIFYKIYYAAMVSYLLVGMSIKLSLLTFLKEVFPEVKWLNNASTWLIVLLILFSISGEFVLIFQCKPVRAAFDKSIPDSKCYSNKALFAIFMYQGVIMFLINAAIFSMPIPILVKLRLPLKTRMLLVFLFSFGLLACISALLRFSTLTFVLKADYTYLLAYALICSNIEFNLALVAGSLPSLRILMGVGVVLAPRRASQETETIFPVITRGRSVELRKIPSRMTEPLGNGRRSSALAGEDVRTASREFYSQFGEVGEEAMAGMSGVSGGEGSTSGGEGERQGQSASTSGRVEGGEERKE
ncbi:hypothetical protein FQN50_005827 [Emmonsiellopsis sp. PD_5]|nr:hypothetical protein FQN50_005827 [Emmonsiellopsis sp. PD_5]